MSYLRSPLLPPLPTLFEELETLEAMREEKFELRSDVAIRVRELTRRAATLRDWEAAELAKQEELFEKTSRELDALTAAVLRAGGTPR